MGASVVALQVIHFTPARPPPGGAGRVDDGPGTGKEIELSEPKKKARVKPAALVPLVLLLGGFAANQGYHAWVAHEPLEVGGMVEVRTIQVASRAGGRVVEVKVHEGDRVTKGQELVTLERTELEAKRDEARAAMELAQAQLDRTTNGPRTVEVDAYHARVAAAQAQLDELARGARHEDVEHARAQLAAAESQLKNAELAASRNSELFKSGAIAKAQVDDAVSQLDTARANRDAAKSALEVLADGSRPEVVAAARARLADARAQLENTKLGSRDEDVRVARAQLVQAQARLALAEHDLAETSITAPRDCVVEALDLRPGDMLSANQGAATLVENDQLFVRAYVPETELGLVHVGDTLPFTVDTFTGHDFHAIVQHVNDVGEYTPRNVQTVDERANQVYLVRLGVADGQDHLRAGMAVTLRMPRRHP
jgi:multidrug resistance efflux pump